MTKYFLTFVCNMITVWLFAGLSALILGIAKGGVKGLGILVVMLMAHAFGAKDSTGIILPLLILGDTFSINFYRKHVRWNYLYRFLPFMIVGVLVGVYFGKNIPEDLFKNIMGAIVLISVGIMWWREKLSNKTFKDNWLFRGATGISAGFSTMVGNLAGAFTNLYFLSTKLSKNEIIGTAAWLYFIVNLFKLPFHIFSWKTINLSTLKIDLILAPIIIIGFYLGTRIVERFSEKLFRDFLLIVTAIGAIFIFIR